MLESQPSTCYPINDGNRILGKDGKAVVLAVDGAEKPLRSGKYKGEIFLTLK